MGISFCSTGYKKFHRFRFKNCNKNVQPEKPGELCQGRHEDSQDKDDW